MHPFQSPGDVGQLCLVLGRLDPEHVRACIAVAQRAVDRLVDAVDRQAVGAGDDHEVLVGPRRDGRLQLADHLAGRDHVLALHVAAALGRLLVLQVDARHAARLVVVHRADHVDRVAVAGVGICDHRDGDRLRHAPGVLDHLAARQQRHIGTAEQGAGGGEAAHVDDVEAGLLDQPSGQPVVGTDGQHGRGPQELPQPGVARLRALEEIRHVLVSLSYPAGRARGPRPSMPVKMDRPGPPFFRPIAATCGFPASPSSGVGDQVQRARRYSRGVMPIIWRNMVEKWLG